MKFPGGMHQQKLPRSTKQVNILKTLGYYERRYCFFRKAVSRELVLSLLAQDEVKDEICSCLCRPERRDALRRRRSRDVHDQFRSTRAAGGVVPVDARYAGCLPPFSCRMGWSSAPSAATTV